MPNEEARFFQGGALLGESASCAGRMPNEEARCKFVKHRKLKYESSNDEVAEVSKKGTITAVGEGKCYIYVYTQSGKYAYVKVTVEDD